jgi:hypothetical protein
LNLGPTDYESRQITEVPRSKPKSRKALFRAEHPTFSDLGRVRGMRRFKSMN